MKNNKIGSLFVITTLALTGIGISYAGFSDTISVYGTVDTATVNLDIVDYSGTWLWKVWGTGAPAGEVEIFRGLTSIYDDQYMIGELTNMYPNCQYEKVSWAYAQAGANDKEVEMIYHNIFPCTEYTADVYVHYTGTIPAYTSIQNEVWDPVFEIDDLWDINFYAEKGVQDTTGTYIWTDTDLPVQLHDCNQLKIELGIHMLQPENANDYQGIVDAAFSFDIEALQWYDPCDQVTFEPGEPTNKNKGFGVRFKSFDNGGDKEFYLGVGNLGVPGNRLQMDVNWQSINAITFTYDKPNDQLIATIDLNKDGTIDHTLTYPGLAAMVASKTSTTVNDVNAMVLSVVCRSTTNSATIDFNNVMLDTNTLGNFHAECPPDQWATWTISGFDFTQAFTMTGDLILGGDFDGGGGEKCKVELLVIEQF